MHSFCLKLTHANFIARGILFDLSCASGHDSGEFSYKRLVSPASCSAVPSSQTWRKKQVRGSSAHLRSAQARRDAAETQPRRSLKFSGKRLRRNLTCSVQATIHCIDTKDVLRKCVTAPMIQRIKSPLVVMTQPVWIREGGGYVSAPHQATPHRANTQKQKSVWVAMSFNNYNGYTGGVISSQVVWLIGCWLVLASHK